MTTSATTPRLSYVADGSTVQYTFNFEIADSSSIAVYVGSTLKTLTTDYTVAFDSGTSGTGTITLLSAPADGSIIYLVRDTYNVRSTDFEDSGAFLASTVNNELDRLTQGLQDLENRLDNRVLESAEPNDESARNLTIPNASTRANKTLTFDASGDVQMSDAAGSVTSVGTGTGLTGGPITTSGTISIDTGTTVDVSTAQTLTNKTLTAPTINGATMTGNVTVDNITLNDNIISSASNADLILDPNGTGGIKLNATTTLAGNIAMGGNTIRGLDVFSYPLADSDVAHKKYVDDSVGAVIFDPSSSQVFSNKTIDTANNTITVNEADIADLQSYITASSTDTLTNKTFDANGTGNSISNIANSSLSNSTITMVGDDSTGTAVSLGETFKIAGAGGVTTAVSGDTLTVTGPTGTLSNVVEDTTPQLGADLDLNSNNITGTGEINITGDIKTPTIMLDSDDVTIRGITANTSIGLVPNGTGDVYATSDIIANGDLIATGRVQNEAISIGGLFNDQDSYIQGRRSNENIVIDPAGTGGITLNAATTLAGNIAMGGNKITGLAFPTAGTDAAHKSYVDDEIGAIYPITVQTITQGNTSATVADSGTGSFVVTVDGNNELTVTDDGVRIHGNLTVDGTQTILNTSTLSVEDNIITVNRNVSTVGAMPSNSGLEINRGDATAATLYWNETDDRWDISGTVSTRIRTDSITDQGSGIDFNAKTLTNVGSIQSNGYSAGSGQDFYIGLQNNLSDAFRIVNSSGTNIITIDAGSGSDGDTVNFEGNINTSYTASRPFTFSNTLTASGTANFTGTATFTGTVAIDNLNILDNKITSDSNADIILDPGGTGEIAMGTDVRISDNTQDHFIGNIKNDNGNSLQLSTVGGGGIDIAPSGSGVTVFSYLQTSGDDNYIQTDSIKIDSGSGVISGRRSNEDISIQPAGTGKVEISGAYKLPSTDGSANQILKTDGAGTLSFVDSPLGDFSATGSTLQSPSNADITLQPGGTGTIQLDANTVVTGILTATSLLKGYGLSASADANFSISHPYVNRSISVDIPSGSGAFKVNSTEIRLGDPSAEAFITTDSTSGFNFYVPTNKYFHINGVDITGNQIKTYESNADLELSANGSGTVTVNGLAFPTADGTNGQVLTTDGAGNLSFTTVASGSTDPITFVGDDSTGTAVNTGETFKIAGTQNITTAVSGDTLTVTGPDLSSYLTAETNDLTSAVTWANVPDANITQSSVTQHQAALSITESQISDLQSYITDANITIVGDDSTGVTFSAKNNDDITITGTGGITSTVSGNTITIDGSGVSGGGAATGLTFVGDDSTGTLIADGETVKIAGGTGITTAMSGDTLTITASGSASTGDFVFTGNNMSTGSSNADTEIEASGTGRILLQANGAPDLNAGELETWTTSDYRVAGATHITDVITGITPGNREYKYDSTFFKTDGTDSASGSARFRKLNQVVLDLNGSELTATGGSRGLQIQDAILSVNSDTVNTAVLGNHGGHSIWSVVGNDGGSNFDGNITATTAYGFRVNTATVTNNASTTISVTNAYGVDVNHSQYGPGTQTTTNYTAFNYSGGGNAATNTPYLLNTSDDKMKTRPGALEKFNEWAYTATHSSGGTYTVDWANGNLQTVTLTSNITSFTMSNFPTDTNQSVGITLYLVQDGTGSRTMSFTAGSGETFKFANGANTSSVSLANDIQTVYIFSKYNGSALTYYWTLGPTYS